MKNALIFIALLVLSACKVENLNPTQDVPKVDFSTYNYVLAAEDASSEDITTFFAFNRSDIDSEKQYDLIQEDKLFIAVPNVEKDKFNGFLSIDKSGTIKKEISIENKYRPTQLYKLNN
jgi:hypothetical protein